jgi:uncharacterized membrane protein YdjX (TVP38/TMEM64 family)
MKRYSVMVGVIFGLLLILFLVGEGTGIPLLREPSPWLGSTGTLTVALFGSGLLLADVVLPVPSSAVMVAHGALFGAVGGTLLSVGGSMGATLVGFSIGRRGGPLLARLVPPKERARADHILSRWGGLAIVVTRPVPLLAETVAIMTGTSPLGWRQASLAALLGSLPPALLYALSGASAVALTSGILVFGLVLVVAGIFWLVGYLAEVYLAVKRKRSS